MLRLLETQWTFDMAIDLGKFDKKKNYGRGISLGVYDKIPEDLDFEAFKREYLEREKRSIGESVWEWADAFPTGVSQMVDSAKEAMTNKSVVGGMFNFTDFEEMKDAWKTVGMTAKIGLADEWHTYRAIKNNIANELSSGSQDDKIRKAYELRKFRENYFNVDRENMLSEVPEEFRADADFGADFLTPTNLMPAFFGKKVMDKPVRATIKGGVKGLSLVAKGAEKVSEGVEKALGYPSKKLDEVLPKGGVAYRGVQMIGLASDTGIGTFFGSMVFVEGLAKIAKKTSREISEVSRVFAQPSSHARFLYRLSTDEAVSASTRKLAARMYKLRGTRAYDVLFDGLVAGLSSSAVQSAMEFAQGSSAEEMGQASGAGFVLGAPVGMASGSRNSGKADEDRSDLSISNYLEKKANQQNQDTVKALKKLDRDTLISLSTMDEFAELGNYNMQMLDHKTFKERILAEDEDADSKNLPAASYNQETKVILLDESKLKEGTEKARKIVMHEIGHAYMREMLGSNPLMRRKILEKFEDENGREYFFIDKDGVKNGSIKVNKQAENFMREYALLMGVKPKDFAKSKYANDAFLLAEEIGAEQFSALMRENPNVFKRYEKSFRHSLLNAGKDVLSKLGVIDADSGNLIDSPISVSLRKNKDVQNLFTNYMQARNDHYRIRADDIEKGRKHEPRKGQDSADRFTELFGGHGINIGIGSHFAVKDRQMFDELVKAVETDAQGADSDLTGIGKNFEGKRLGAQTKDIFRKAGANGGGAMNIIDFFQNVIDTRTMIKFGYRSAKWWDRSHYNPFYERSFTAIGWQITPKKPTTRMGRTVYPNLKIVGYDADLIMSNAELLSQAGFLKGKYKDTAEFLDAFSEHAESLLQQTGEKRINPLGQGENELFVAALGRIAGQKFIPKIQDPELSDFFTDPNSKLKQAYRSYDVGAMAGVTSLNKKGLAFNYNNAKHNYMPSLSGAGSEGSTIPRTLYMPSSPFSAYAQELWRLPEQAITSADTSINDKKLPAGFTNLIKKNIFKKNQIVVDIGGGKFDNAVDKLKSIGAYLHVYDPFNRSTKHNEDVIRKVADGGADVAVSNNTLNVIAEDKNIIKVIAQSHNALKDNGKAYFTVYEGDRSGMGKVTSKGFQRNLPTQSYIDMVKEVYGNNVKKEGNVIVATKKPLKLVKEDILFKQSGEDAEHGYVPSVIKNADDSMPLYIPDFLVGKTVFPIMGDRLMVGMYTARSGNVFECRGGHNHPLVDEYKKQVAWACGQSGSETMGRVEQGLLSAINGSDGYAVTILMNEDAVASNRTYARILLDELLYDAYHVKGGMKIVEKHIQQAVGKWRDAIINKAKKKKQTVPQAVLDADFRTIDDLKESLPTMNFEHRKELVSKIMSNDYKKEIASVAGKGYKAINWIDLYNSMIEFPKSEGYRTGDMIHVLKFDKSNPIIKLSEIGASPDPTYDVSFRGSLVHSFEGRVSAFDFFKKGLDYFAYDQDYLASAKKVASSDRTLKKDRSVGSRANRMLQLKYDDPVFKTKMSKRNTMPPAKPIKFKKGTKAENRYLEERNILNADIRKRKLAELKG